MARGLGDGLLRLCNGAWRDNDGDAVDIVEVVRCMYCKHYTPLEGGKPLCAYHVMGVFANDFCSYGERRTDE